jgi:hypothetical protein
MRLLTTFFLFIFRRILHETGLPVRVVEDLRFMTWKEQVCSVLALIFFRSIFLYKTSLLNFFFFL